MSTNVIALGDRVRLTAHPKAPRLVVQTLYVQGPDEEPWAACSWMKGAPLVHFPVASLEPAP